MTIPSSSPLPRANAPTVPDLRGDDRSGVVEAYDRDVIDIVRWAQRGGWLCCTTCGAYGPYTMLDGRAFCAICIREGSARLFTAAEHAASEREAARPSLMEFNDAVRGTPYKEAE